MFGNKVIFLRLTHDLRIIIYNALVSLLERDSRCEFCLLSCVWIIGPLGTVI